MLATLPPRTAYTFREKISRNTGCFHAAGASVAGVAVVTVPLFGLKPWGWSPGYLTPRGGISLWWDSYQGPNLIWILCMCTSGLALLVYRVGYLANTKSSDTKKVNVF